MVLGFLTAFHPALFWCTGYLTTGGNAREGLLESALEAVELNIRLATSWEEAMPMIQAVVERVRRKDTGAQNDEPR